MLGIRYKIETLNYILRAHDIGIITLSFFITYSLNLDTLYHGHYVAFSDDAHKYIWIYIFTSFSVAIILNKEKIYTIFKETISFDILKSIVKSIIINFIIILIIVNIVRLNNNTLLLFYFSCITFILLILGRLSIRTILGFFYQLGHYQHNILIVGTSQRAFAYAERLASHRDWGLHIVGYVDNQPTHAAQKILGRQIIGKIDDIPSIIESNIIDEVVIILPPSWISQLEKTIQTCEMLGTEVTIVADFFHTNIAKISLSLHYDTPLLTYSTLSQKKIQLLLKNIIDFVGSLILLIFAFPLFVMCAIAIKLSSNGPIIYKQTRCGLNGRLFTMYKFRTMFVNAEDQLPDLQRHNEMLGPVFKMKNDPRVTAVGRFLRRTSLDELPQLFNVVTGVMSLVGPRPSMPHEVANYDPWQRRRLSVKPGLSCIWQISGRNQVDFKEWMELDLYYIDHWSLWLDVKILLKTLPAVVKGVGAY